MSIIYAMSNTACDDDGVCRSNAMRQFLRLSLVIVLVLVTFGIYLSIYGDDAGYDVDVSDWLPGYPEGDPNLGSVGSTKRWLPLDYDENSEGGEEEYYHDESAGGGGLTLRIVDNLSADSDWHAYLSRYVAEWDDGVPDAVSLDLLVDVEYDPMCRGIVRTMMVCNGNYGPTEWNGINQILTKDGYILSSIARMNDYYLNGTNNATKGYTMCHELGHGLGLGHSDENFHNYDMGNCMDYTNHPEYNLHPDEYNFLILEGMYGNVTDDDGGANDGEYNGVVDGDVVQVSSAMRYVGDGEGDGEGEYDIEDDGGGGSRHRRGDRGRRGKRRARGRRRRTTREERRAMYEEYDLYASGVLNDDSPLPRVSSSSSSSSGRTRTPMRNSRDDGVDDDDGGSWRLLSRTTTTEYHERVLGDGYAIRASILLAA
jgi:hypothetical protein